jgi:uncharacterized protein
MIRAFACLALLLCPTLVLAQARLAIIIDDLGYHRSRGEAIIALPGTVTCAVIPQTPHAPALARLAKAAGKEVILHMPMETDGYGELDAGGLHEGMSEVEFASTIQAAVERIPEARGLNNHMGGVLTADETAMDWLMTRLAEHNLFFVDSRTTPQTVAGRMARHHGLPYAGRDIFLDNERDLAAINEQFNRAIAIAQRRGHAIVIGHPYPETIDYLQQVLPLLEPAGITLVPVSQLLNRPQMARHKAANGDDPL